MKIIYEPGDIVEVEDDANAGGFAACTVELLNKSETLGAWYVKTLDGLKPSPEYGYVDEIYLYPG